SSSTAAVNRGTIITNVDSGEYSCETDCELISDVETKDCMTDFMAGDTNSLVRQEFTPRLLILQGTQQGGGPPHKITASGCVRQIYDLTDVLNIKFEGDLCYRYRRIRQVVAHIEATAMVQGPRGVPGQPQS
ncbi:MAG TPA: hypothetical protein VI338_04575, partial [Nitrososphaera sp.]|nr:hypothetical protein [Nitrososphaera sp.]